MDGNHYNTLYVIALYSIDLDDSGVKFIANTLSNIGNEYLVEVFLGELGCNDVNKKRSLKPEYISNEINQWKVRDHEVNEGVSPRKVITRKLLKIYKVEELQKFDIIKELARTLDFQGIQIIT